MRFVLLFVVLVLAACSAPMSKQSIRATPAYQLTFSVDASYQSVFSDLLSQTRACYLNKPSVEQLTVVGNRDNGNKTANITMEYVYAMAEHDVILMMDLASKSDSRTQVTVYSGFSRDNRKVDQVKLWLIDNNKACA